MRLLLDTNVISEIRRGRDRNVRDWTGHLADADVYLSVLTIGEIRKGVERLRERDPDQANVFDDWLGELLTDFADRIVGIDVRVAEEWGRLNANGPRNTVDSLIAATAKVHELAVATRNTTDFDGCGVKLINPWTPTSS